MAEYEYGRFPEWNAPEADIITAIFEGINS
jgi:hypothetical protein